MSLLSGLLLLAVTFDQKVYRFRALNLQIKIKEIKTISIFTLIHKLWYTQQYVKLINMSFICLVPIENNLDKE